MKAVEAPLISPAQQHIPAAHCLPPPYRARRNSRLFKFLIISLLLFLIATLLAIGLSLFFYPNLYGVKSEAFLPKGLFARPIRQYNETNWFSHVYQDVHWEPSQEKVDELRPVLPKGHEKVELPGRVVIPCNENCTTGGDVVECCRTHQWNDGVCIEEEQRDGRIERQAVCWQGDGLRIYSRDNPRPQHPATTNASAEAVNAEMPAATEAPI